MKLTISTFTGSLLIGCILICVVSATNLKGADAMNSPKEGTAGGNKEVLTLGGGCFWCIEAILEELKGVESAVSGYAGGSVPKPSYEAVCTGQTGPAEVVQATCA